MSALHNAAIALADLLRSDLGAPVIDYEARRAKARSRLDEWERDPRAAGSWKIDRQALIKRLRTLIAQPEALNQGNLDACGVVSVLYIAFVASPHVLVYGYRQIYEQGRGVLGGLGVEDRPELRAISPDEILEDDKRILADRQARDAYEIPPLDPADWFLITVALSGLRPKMSLKSLEDVRTAGSLSGFSQKSQEQFVDPFTSLFTGCTAIRHSTIDSQFDAVLANDLAIRTPGVHNILWLEQTVFSKTATRGNKHIVVQLEPVSPNADPLSFTVYSFGRRESTQPQSQSQAKANLAQIFKVTVK